MEKDYTLSEFVYTFQKMGVSMKLPVIKGIEDYKGAVVDHAMTTISIHDSGILID